jgi:hypothetical protein
MRIEGSKDSFKWGVTLWKEWKTVVQIIQRMTRINAFSWKTKVTVCEEGVRTKANRGGISKD